MGDVATGEEGKLAGDEQPDESGGFQGCQRCDDEVGAEARQLAERIKHARVHRRTTDGPSGGDRTRRSTTAVTGRTVRRLTATATPTPSSRTASTAPG